MPQSPIYQLLRYGQIFLVYPAAFLDRLRRVTTPLPPYEDLEIQTSDNVILRCCLLRPQGTPETASSTREGSEARLGTVILFHGNAMNYGDLRFPAMMYYQMKYNVLMVSYRGYGNSDGRPSERGLQKDAQAALDHLLNDPEHSKKPIILCGLSLGGAVAIDLASRNPFKIAALIVENTFTSLPDVVHDWPLIGHFSFLCHQRWNSASKIPLLPASLPFLLLSGARDEVVPRKHMMALRDLAQRRGQKKVKSRRRTSNLEDTKDETAVANTTFVSLPNGFHANTFNEHDYWPAVILFLSGICAPVPSSPSPAPLLASHL